MINCYCRTKIWQNSLLISNMLTCNNTSVNIKEEDGFFVPYESKTISGKVKNCSITNFTGGQVLVVIKNIRKQNHLGLNNMLLNYYKWRQIMHCKSFVTANELRWLWSAIKFISLDFQRETILITEKHIAEKELYMHWKPAISLNFTPLYICHPKRIYYSVYCGLDLGYFLYNPQLVSQIWTLQNTSLHKSIMKPKPVQYLQYVHYY